MGGKDGTGNGNNESVPEGKEGTGGAESGARDGRPVVGTAEGAGRVEGGGKTTEEVARGVARGAERGAEDEVVLATAARAGARNGKLTACAAGDVGREKEDGKTAAQVA